MVLRADSGIFITNTFGEALYTPSRLINTISGAYLSSAGDWTNASDKNVKENFVPADGKKILEAIASLPINRWNYKNDNPGITHIGPTAQDFNSAFGVGAGDKSISTVDPSGIALAAIKELYRTQKQLESKSREVDELKSRLSEISLQLDRLNDTVSRLTAGR